ncbi:MAG: hypothetical protein KJP03_03860, partial [Gammaproteobacteria bacterium]|nr:hypothetical protein [Gammaproteobacteria bacterium]
MNARVLFLLVFLVATGSAGAQTFEYLEDFENGDADWVDFDRNTVTHNATGGHDGGAYISTTRDIVTQPANPFGSGLIQFRCAIAPSQLPSQNCSDEIFVGDYIAMPVTELRFWFRHNSVQNQQVFIRIPTPANTPGASAFVDAPIPPNVWTEMVLDISPTNPEWEPQFGGSTYNNILSNVGRLQPGVYYDIGVDYTEPNVTFDIDDVRITGTGLNAPIRITQQGFADTLHAHHKGQQLTSGSLPDDNAIVWVYGQSTAAGDAIDLDASTIDVDTLRFGPGQTAVDAGATQETGGIDLDSDGIDDSRYRF